MVIVIGGTGLVGSHLLFELAKTEERIVATFQTEKKIQKVQALFNFYGDGKSWSKIEWKKVDINDLFELEELISSGDEVYHCAALVSFHRKDFNQMMKVNREGTTNIVNTCLAKEIKKLLYVSSTAAVSGGAETSVTEKTKWKKTSETSAYSISKNGAEREVWRGITEGLNAAMVNPSVILGAGDWSESSLTILGQIKKGLSFYPPGANAIVDARDVARVMHQLMKSDISEERFLLIGENVSFQSLFTQIAQKMKKSPPKWAVSSVGLNMAKYLFGFIYLFSSKKSPITDETVNSAMSSTVYSNEKVKKALNYTFYSLKDTIENAINGRIK
jgi:nucleoside-diphosphate-sugar epimerase